MANPYTSADAEKMNKEQGLGKYYVVPAGTKIYNQGGGGTYLYTTQQPTLIQSWQNVSDGRGGITSSGLAFDTSNLQAYNSEEEANAVLINPPAQQPATQPAETPTETPQEPLLPDSGVDPAVGLASDLTTMPSTQSQPSVPMSFGGGSSQQQLTPQAPRMPTPQVPTEMPQTQMPQVFNNYQGQPNSFLPAIPGTTMGL